MNNEQVMKLWKSLEKLEIAVNGYKKKLDDMGIDFKATLAECCIYSKSAREIIEYNTMCRVQYNRVLDELAHLEKLLGFMTAAVVAQVVE